MRKHIKIGNRRIGPQASTFIIAEAGVNHNGKLRLAKQLVDVAAKAGADAVKFQTYRSERVVAKGTKVAEYQEKQTQWEDQLEMIKSFELSLGAFEELHQYCKKKGIMFLSTPHSNGEILEFLDEIVPAFKVASPDLTNHPFLRKIASRDKPIILSTGMGTMQEVKEALNVIKEEENEEIILLHCTSNYPCPLEEVNLRTMQTMQEELDYPIGYSDHTVGNIVPIMVTALGAVVLEKHFTVDKDLPGPDHEASLEPSELNAMVQAVRDAEKALGRKQKKPTSSEKKIMEKTRKSLVAARNIRKNTKIREKDLNTKRPRTGIQPKQLQDIIGRKAKINIKKDEIITYDKIK